MASDENQGLTRELVQLRGDSQEIAKLNVELNRGVLRANNL
jgi:hypothetical protein